VVTKRGICCKCESRRSFTDGQDDLRSLNDDTLDVGLCAFKLLLDHDQIRCDSLARSYVVMLEVGRVRHRG